MSEKIKKEINHLKEKRNETLKMLPFTIVYFVASIALWDLFEDERMSVLLTFGSIVLFIPIILVLIMIISYQYQLCLLNNKRDKNYE